MYLDCLNNKNTFDETQEILKSKNLQIKTYNDKNLYLVKYDKSNCDMSDDDVKKCRGIILEKDTNRLICVPPPHHDSLEEINNFDFEKITCEEYVEGSMINIFKYNNNVEISTRSCIGGKNKFSSKKSFLDMFLDVIDITKFNFLPDNVSLTFIIQHPENIIVNKFSKPDLVLVYAVEINNTINIIKLEDQQKILKDNKIEVSIPQRFEFSDINDVYYRISKMDKNEQGIVLKYIDDEKYIRCKIRNDYHNYIRNLRSNCSNKKYLFLNLRKNDQIQEYLKYFEEDTELFRIFELELNDTKNILFNFYQSYYVRKPKINFKDILFEYRPLCIDLHNDFKTNKSITTKNKVSSYIDALPTAKKLFVINYKYRK